MAAYFLFCNDVINIDVVVSVRARGVSQEFYAFKEKNSIGKEIGDILIYDKL